MTGDAHRLSDEQLAAAVGVTRAAVDQWRSLGLLHSTADNGTVDDLERARLVVFATERGIALETLARVNAEQEDLLGRFVSLAGVSRGPGRPLAAAAGAAGLDEELAARAWAASGLGDQSEVFDEDVSLLETVVTALAGGFPEDALLQLLRVYGDAVGKVADAESRLFHLHVHEPLRQEGLDAAELAHATRTLSDSVISLIEPTLLYFHRKAWERAIRDDLLLHLREDDMPAGDVGEIPVSVLFVDVASFTPFAHAAGDTAAADLLDRFASVARGSAAAHHGRVIKQIGDEFMMIFDRPIDAARCGIELQRRAMDDPALLGVRVGAHTGTAVYRQGDYFGSVVNIAARVSAEARRGEFLVTADMREAAEAGEIRFEFSGQRRLKGVETEIELFAATAG